MSKRKRNPKMLLIFILSLCLIPLLQKREEIVTVEFSNPKYGTILETVPAIGKIQPVIEVNISPDISGEIVDIYCSEGDTVQKGDLLIKIQQDVYISAIQRAEALLNSTKALLIQQEAQYSLAVAQLDRNKELFLDSIISKTDYETSLTEVAIEKGRLDEVSFNLKSDEASLQEMKEQLSKTMIYAPISGIISKLLVEKGERVVGTSQMAGTELLRIANFEQVEVISEINENDILKVNCGDSAILSLGAYYDMEFRGTVTSIANSSSNSFIDQAVNFEIKIGIIPESYSNLLKGSNLPFRPGMSASATIFTDKKENILIVPLQSVVYKDNQESVWIVDEKNTAKLRKVQTGIQDISWIEIKSGLNTNDRIIIGPYSAISKELHEGDLVSNIIKE